MAMGSNIMYTHVHNVIVSYVAISWQEYVQTNITTVAYIKPFVLAEILHHLCYCIHHEYTMLNHMASDLLHQNEKQIDNTLRKQLQRAVTLASYIMFTSMISYAVISTYSWLRL